MMFEYRTFKKAILAASFAVAAFAGATTAASAHQSYTRCDSDGDRCWRVICDDDGDDCRRVPLDRDRYSYWNNRYRYGQYGQSYGDRSYDNGRHGRWVCDDDGDRCRWVATSWSWWGGR
jgi:hypothetical protein